MKKIGLRIDVDTYTGTREGVVRLNRILAKHDIQATFFFSVGPDNMGRNLWRLFRPAFLWKMLRSNAPGLYGLDILLKGTFWPGPRIGRAHSSIIQDSAKAGHEIGVHAWDHYRWQIYLSDMSEEYFAGEFERAYRELESIIGIAPTCSANPAWKFSQETLKAKEKFSLLYNSDCKGHSIFRPVLDNGLAATVQIPTTLPVYDEVIGVSGVDNENYNEFSLKQLKENSLNVLTIHAEAEGRILSDMFENYLNQAKACGYSFVPLGSLLDKGCLYPEAKITARRIPGRDGLVAVQE